MNQDRFMKHTGLLIALLSVLSAVSLLLAVGIGPVSVSPVRTIMILFSKLPGLDKMVPVFWESVEENIVIGLRLPRVLLGWLVGASLSVTGVTMQALVRNQLADPFVLGVSSGASVTATLGMLFGAFSFLGVFSLSISAFLGSAVTILFVYTISRVRGKINITQLLLSGVAVSMILDGVTRAITLAAPNALGLHNATFWMSGSLAGARWEYLGLSGGVLLFCMILLLLHSRVMNVLLMGEESAGALGVEVGRTQKLLILTASLMTGVTVAVSGTIGFVGLMVPHFTRLLVGSDHRRVLPVSALLGGALVVWVDVAARTLIAPEELPAGILTAVLGGPLFLWMLRRRTRQG